MAVAPTHDSVVEAVVEKFQERSRLGIEKYGTTLDRTDLTPRDWVRHAQEEHMDAILYLERLQRDIVRLEDENTDLRADLYNITTISRTQADIVRDLSKKNDMVETLYWLCVLFCSFGVFYRHFFA